MTLHHEHIVRINDPANRVGAWLTREQLWEGLRHTVVSPQVLDESIDDAAIEQLDAQRLRRCIRRGPNAMSDEVELEPYKALQITADAGEFAGSTLRMQIEEPAPEMLFVRFTYEIRGLAELRDVEEDNARCSAYQTSDIDRIRAARRFVAAS